MEEYVALSYIYRLSNELAKDPDLFYRLDYLLGYRGELVLLLLYSHFNYKLSLYSILMSSFPIFSIHLHQHMLTLGLDDFYFELLRHLHLLQVFWPDISLHAPTYLNVPNTSKNNTE